MDPAMIALIITSGLTLASNIFQSIRSGHFKMKSHCQCCEMEYDKPNEGVEPKPE